jgi:hypothetical protein
MQSRARRLLTQWWCDRAYQTHHHAPALNTTTPARNDWMDVALNTPQVALTSPAAVPVTT